jgi:hypothetical protein
MANKKANILIVFEVFDRGLRALKYSNAKCGATAILQLVDKFNV